MLPLFPEEVIFIKVVTKTQSLFNYDFNRCYRKVLVARRVIGLFNLHWGDKWGSRHDFLKN